MFIGVHLWFQSFQPIIHAPFLFAISIAIESSPAPYPCSLFPVPLPLKKSKRACKPGSVRGAFAPVNGHSSGTYVAARLKRPTRNRRGPRQRFPIWTCSGRGLASRRVATTLVRSYRTFSPLPALRRAVYFLCHFPSACAAFALRSVLPCGARTFLDTAEAVPRPFGPLAPSVYMQTGGGFQHFNSVVMEIVLHGRYGRYGLQTSCLSMLSMPSIVVHAARHAPLHHGRAGMPRFRMPCIRSWRKP